MRELHIFFLFTYHLSYLCGSTKAICIVCGNVYVVFYIYKSSKYLQLICLRQILTKNYNFKKHITSTLKRFKNERTVIKNNIALGHVKFLTFFNFIVIYFLTRFMTHNAAPIEYGDLHLLFIEGVVKNKCIRA